MKKTWIKFDRSTLLTHDQIGVDTNVFNVIGNMAWIKFGQKKLLVEVIELNDSLQQKQANFQNPQNLPISQVILEKLFIQPSNVYQMKYSRGEIEIGPVIGLLLGEQQYYYHDSTMGEYTDALSAYTQIGGLVYAFKTCSIDWRNQCVYGLYFDHEKRKWGYSKFPLPSVIYRRAFNISGEVVKQLENAIDGKIFNSRKYSKWQLYKILKTNDALNKYLPETVPLKSTELVREILGKHSNVILKPIGLSRGRGICIMQKKNNTVFLRDYHDGTKVTEFSFTEDEAMQYIQDRQFYEKRYIVQPFIEFAKINNAPWDIRVVMQKNPHNEWACHGIECRVAGMGDLVTNISRGGRALSISEAIKQSFGRHVQASKIKDELVKMCKKLSKALEADGENLAELGVDIALDKEMNFWIIESNVRPTYNGFKRHMDYNNYLFLCSSPVIYACTMAGFDKGGIYETEA